MQYSTLQEAYNLDGFDKMKKKKKDRTLNVQESNLSKGPSNIEMSKDIESFYINDTDTIDCINEFYNKYNLNNT